MRRIDISRVALLTHDLSLGGGTGRLTRFLHRVLRASGRYDPEVVSLAMSSSDTASISLRRPRSWRTGIQVRHDRWEDLDYLHVGARGSELEWQRYRPRPELDDLLAGFDLVQLVVGTPPWGCVAFRTGLPVALWTATTTWSDRSRRVCQKAPPARLWALAMTGAAQICERQALRQADIVFGLSRYTMEALQPLTSREVHLATGGVDLDLYKPVASPSGDYILSVGRHSDARKNLPMLLRAYARLKVRHESSSTSSLPDLYLVGDDPTPSAKALITALGLDRHVRLLGFQPENRLSELYANAAIYVLSSDEEGLGLVLLEAMASGVAVVSTSSGGPATAVVPGETGLLTPVGDEAAMAEALWGLSRDPDLRARMGGAGRTRAEQVFSIEKAGEVFLDQYDKVLSVSTSHKTVA